jgi:hypothetical protein
MTVAVKVEIIVAVWMKVAVRSCETWIKTLVYINKRFEKIFEYLKCDILLVCKRKKNQCSLSLFTYELAPKGVKRMRAPHSTVTRHIFVAAVAC